MKNPRRLSSALAALTLWLAVAPALAQAPAPAATPAASPDGDEAKARFTRGVQLFREGDFRSALVEFRRSYEVSHNFKVLYNIGQTAYELSDYAGALRSFRRYLELGAKEIDAARKGEVEQDIQRLGDRVARLEIHCNLDGAEVVIDDVVVGSTPLAEAVLVSIGRRKVTVQKDGVVSAARFVDLAGGDQTTLKIELLDARPVSAAPVATPLPSTPPTAPVAPAEPSRTALWSSLAVTGGLVVGTAIVGGLALAAHGDAEKTLSTFGSKAADIEAARAKTQTLALVADVMGGAALAMTVVTIVIGVTGGKKDTPSARAATLGLGPGSAWLRATF